MFSKVNYATYPSVFFYRRRICFYVVVRILNCCGGYYAPNIRFCASYWYVKVKKLFYNFFITIQKRKQRNTNYTNISYCIPYTVLYTVSILKLPVEPPWVANLELNVLGCNRLWTFHVNCLQFLFSYYSVITSLRSSNLLFNIRKIFFA